MRPFQCAEQVGGGHCAGKVEYMKKIAALLGRLLTLAGLAAPLSLWGFGFWVDDLYYRSPSGSETQVYVTECYFDPMMGVTSITIPAEVEGEYYDYDYDETRRRVCTVIGIYDYSFSGWRELTNVTMPNSITIIGSCAFANCWGLTSVTIPDSVTTIGYAAFGGCRGLTSVTIGNNVTSIGDYAFSGCSGLTNVKLPATVTNVSINAFGGVTGGSITVYAPWSLWGVLESGLSSGTMVNVEFYGEEPNFDVVSFNVNGGDELAKSEKRYIDGRAIGAMPEPMRAGYAFSGWFTAAEGGTPVTADTVVTGGMTVYAHWVESPFTFRGNAAWVSDGDGIWRSGRISESQTSSAEMFVVGPAEVSFKWKTSSRRGWDRLRFTIDADYASEISGVMDGWGEFSHVIKAEGEHVLRWEYSKDGSVSDGADCGWVKDVVVEPVTIRKVAFNVNGGDVLAKPEKSCVDGRAIGAMPEPTRSGYAFSGWFTAAEGGTPVTADTVVTGDMTVYARWVESPFTFGGNAAWVSEGDGIWRSGRLPYWGCSSAEMFVVGPAVVNFKWKTSSTRIENRLRFAVDADYVSEISGVMGHWDEYSHEIEAGDHVLRWEFRKGYGWIKSEEYGWVKDIVVEPVTIRKVAFNVNGGDELAEPEKRYIDGRALGAMPEPTRSGYAFSGWFTAAEGGTPVTADTVVTGGMTVYAHWVESPFTFRGNAAWVSDGDGIWRSGRISESQTSSAEMFVVGPAEVSFKWKTSSRRGWDRLRFTIDADYASEISGVMDGWGEFSHVIKAEGEHVLRWEYSKDGSVSDGADCGWVKDIVVTSMDDDGFTATIGGKEVAVPEAWINSHSELIEALGGDAASALNATAANGRRSVAECYVLGIDPEDPDDDFKITSFEIVNGEPVFTVSHTEDGSGVSFEPRIRKLGKTNLGDQWQEVPEGGDPSFRFFTVTVDLP